MVQMVERQVRTRAQQLFESRGQGQGQDLQDWFQAESEILENSTIATLYRRMRNPQPAGTSKTSEPELVS